MKRMGDISSEHSKVLPVDKEKIWSDEKKLDKKFFENVFIKHLSGPLFFGFTAEFLSLSQQIPKTASIVILRMEKVPYVDQSGLYALEDVLIDLEQHDITCLVVGARTQPKYLMKSIGILGKLIPENHTFDSFTDSQKWVHEQLNEKK